MEAFYARCVREGNQILQMQSFKSVETIRGYTKPYDPTLIRVLRDGRSGPHDHLCVHTRCRTFASARIHPFGLDHRGGGGSRQVGDERLGGCRFFGVRRDGCREHDFLLQFGGERTDHI